MHGKEGNKREKKGRSAWNVTLCNDEPANVCFLLLRTLPLNLTLHNFYKGKGQSTHRCTAVRFPQHWSGVFSQMGYTNTNTHLQSALHWGRKNTDGLKSQAGQRVADVEPTPSTISTSIHLVPAEDRPTRAHLWLWQDIFAVHQTITLECLRGRPELRTIMLLLGMA